MQHSKAELTRILRDLDLGSSIAELDTLLETARVETSVFSDLMLDKIDLIPGTKGSGKSALYRILVDFLADTLLNQRKVVVAHGVQRHGDQVFLAYKDHFEQLTEDDFVSFWCIYLVSLAHEQFVKQAKFAQLLSACEPEIRAFRQSCNHARIPEIKAQLGLRDIIGWALTVLSKWRPKLKFILPGEDAGELELDLFGNPIEKTPSETSSQPGVPVYFSVVKEKLESILEKSDLSLWLMIDRLDEIFPRRSALETRALRGLLRNLRVFESRRIRVKVFLRDDILDQVASSEQGFTALTHVTARHADTLRWSEDQILTMIVKRLFAHEPFRTYLGIDVERLNANREYQKESFYKVFPPTVHPGGSQSPTLRWIYTHTADARGVVTPRDVIELLTKAKQRQQDEFGSDPSGESSWIIGATAIQYGLSELSKRKRATLLEAEFPHLWPHIKKFTGGKTEYSQAAISRILRRKHSEIMEDLISIGVFNKTTRKGQITYKVPFVFREGLDLTQGRMD